MKRIHTQKKLAFFAVFSFFLSLLILVMAFVGSFTDLGQVTILLSSFLALTASAGYARKLTRYMVWKSEKFDMQWGPDASLKRILLGSINPTLEEEKEALRRAGRESSRYMDYLVLMAYVEEQKA